MPMKLQPASRREVSRIAVGCAVCGGIEILGFWVLSLLGIGTFSYRILTGAIGGAAVAILNFALMCLMVQKATGTKDEKLLKAKVQTSYNFRLLIQAAWVIIAFAVPWINIIAAAIPLLFPTIIIYFLQSRGKLLPAAPDHTGQDRAASSQDTSEEETDRPGPFEI